MDFFKRLFGGNKEQQPQYIMRLWSELENKVVYFDPGTRKVVEDPNRITILLTEVDALSAAGIVKAKGDHYLAQIQKKEDAIKEYAEKSRRREFLRSDTDRFVESLSKSVKGRGDASMEIFPTARAEKPASRSSVSEKLDPTRWESSLGMVFLPVPGAGVWFSIWQTRVKDYAAFARSTPNVDNSWNNPIYNGLPVTPEANCPVVNVSWDDSKAFCEWLTVKEQKAQLLSGKEHYRLPTDSEWSIAVGLTAEVGATPEEKDKRIKGIFPWGDKWPPPRGAGNFADQTARRAFPNWTIVENYDDGYPQASPVGSFEVNKFGLYDLSGNVWEWCEDAYHGKGSLRVLRGGSYATGAAELLLSSCRGRSFKREEDFGFRCVLSGRNR